MVDVLTSVGSAIVESTFTLGGRRKVLVLREERGTIPRNGLIINHHGPLEYAGPDFVDQPGASKTVVTVADAGLGMLGAGAELRFVERSELWANDRTRAKPVL